MSDYAKSPTEFTRAALATLRRRWRDKIGEGRMTDLERARWLLPDGTDEVEVRVLADAFAVARREGEEGMRERAKAACHERSQWAASKIANEDADAMWATYSNACDDCLYFVAALPLTPVGQPN